MLIWPFLALTFLLFFGLGYVIFNLEKSTIMKNWDSRRCELAVMTAASYFKPPTDPRTSTQFASDNFTFCTGKIVEQFLSMAMAPFISLFKTTTSSAGILSQGMDIVRTILSQIMKQFMDFLEPMYNRYIATTYQIFSIFQHFRSAFERVNAIVLAILFSSLSIIRGLLNMKDFVVKIVLIILGIMVAAIIILFFVLFPFIPIVILPTIAAIEVAVGSGAVSGMRDAFCLAPGSLVNIGTSTNGDWRPIETLKPGDGNGFIEAVIETVGTGVQLWNINGVLLSSYHILWDSTVNNWVFAKDFSGALKSSVECERLYCLTTRTRQFNVRPLNIKNGSVAATLKTSINEGDLVSVLDNDTELICRDWEELDDCDRRGNIEYGMIVAKSIEPSISGKCFDRNVEDFVLSLFENSSTYFIKVNGKFKSLNELGDVYIGNTINEYDKICGVFRCLDSPKHIWVNNKVPKKIFINSSDILKTTPITESGKIHIYDSKGTCVLIIQDMTEIGVDKLSETYDFILKRVNFTSACIA